MSNIQTITLQVVKGIITYIPGVYSVLRRKKMGGTASAEYCYEVWIKHITFLYESGLSGIPKSVAELGPGETIGVGLCALLSGSGRYTGLDVYPYSNVNANLECFDALVEMFKSRHPCTKPSWPDYQQYLDQRSFPSHVLTDNRLDLALRPERIQLIRNQIERAADLSISTDRTGPNIYYIAPWYDKQHVKPDSVDLIISHSVLEHVVDIDRTIEACSSWLRPGGWISHQIDFSSHGLTDEWNGHWAISDFVWKLIIGRRQFLINREPVSRVEDAHSKNDFQVVFSKRRNKDNSINRARLAPQFRRLSASDFSCAEILIQSRK
jgi:SAM-dependent methyltransferase